MRIRTKYHDSCGCRVESDTPFDNMISTDSSMSDRAFVCQDSYDCRVDSDTLFDNMISADASMSDRAFVCQDSCDCRVDSDILFYNMISTDSSMLTELLFVKVTAIVGLTQILYLKI